VYENSIFLLRNSLKAMSAVKKVHGKFVLAGKGFLFEVLGFCPKTNILIFKRFFKRLIKKSE